MSVTIFLNEGSADCVRVRTSYMVARWYAASGMIRNLEKSARCGALFYGGHGGETVRTSLSTA